MQVNLSRFEFDAMSLLRRDGKIVPYPLSLAVVKAATEEAHGSSLDSIRGGDISLLN
jgi:hypothetical protein